MEILLKHSLPQALRKRDSKGFNYRQLDFKSPSGGDLRLQSWREEVEVCVLSQLASAWVGGTKVVLAGELLLGYRPWEHRLSPMGT